MKKSELKALIKKMTLKEKLCQLTQENAVMLEKSGGTKITGPSTVTEFNEEEKYALGSVLNFNGIEDAKKIQKQYLERNRNKIPLLFMQDVIHGYKTIYPVNLGLACSFDMQLIEELSAMAAKEAALNGVKVTFSPMLDLVRDARWGRVVESYGEDPFLGCEIAKATVKGFQGDLGKYKIAACLKHFAAYGACEGGREYNTVDMSERTLREYYLPAFKAAVDSGVRLAMPAFNIFDGIPMAANKRLIDGVLKGEWKFDGVVISDYCAYYETIKHGYAKDYKQAAADCLNAGTDIEMVSASLIAAGEELIKDGAIKEKDIDEAVYKVLKLKNDLGLFENPYGDMDEVEEKAFSLSAENRALARKAANESAVLLKNDGILPISEDKVRKVAVIGPLGNTGDILGRWLCLGKYEDSVTVYDGVKNLLEGKEVEYAEGCKSDLFDVDESGFGQAVALAKSSDVVILCLGEDGGDNGEGTSKMNIDLPDVQYKFFDEVRKVNPNTVVVLFTGRPLSVTRLDKNARAILNVWFPGTEGGNSVADLLFGKANPSGKLTMSFPYSVGQCPIYYNHYNTGRPRSDDNKRCPFQSAYIDGPNKPLYPFGYGLSYTEFAYSDLTADKTIIRENEKLTVSVKIKNVGNREGTEIVQLYIKDWFGSTVRPVKELKGFKRVTLKAGEETVVSFEIVNDMLAFYGADLKRKAEPGKFSAFIGTNSDTNDCIDFELV